MEHVKKVRGWHPPGSDTRVKSIKSDSDEKKRSPGFSEKNRGMTLSVAAPGVTHPSEATEPTIVVIA